MGALVSDPVARVDIVAVAWRVASGTSGQTLACQLVNALTVDKQTGRDQDRSMVTTTTKPDMPATDR